ncbi:MAG: hypothetical protein Q7T55_03560, partial [Solirubrobacteraceae bacterium]|nr:hypothetical protein [Solirubrobacteraceae bacterium]
MRPQVGSVSSPASSLMGVALACGAMAGVMTAPEARAASGDRAKAPVHRTPLATCDTAPGVTVRTTLRWRLFRPNPGDPLAGGSGAIWACRREPGVARHFTQLSPSLENVHRVAGDLVEFDNGGKYTYQTLVVDLATLRYSDVAGDTAERPERALIGSGAIVETGFPAALLGGDDDPASGVWTTTGDPLTATAAFDAPLVRPPVATWPRLRRDGGTQRVRRTFREARTTGATVTPLLGSNVQLEARRATKRRPAGLSMHCPAITAYGSYDGPRQTDVIGRLVPGSESEARAVAPGVVVGRFLDR